MARGVNKAILIGNLGQDPELRYTQGDTAVCNMRVATADSYEDSDGNQVDTTEWHNVVAWGRLAEVCNEYLEKGSRAYFEGSMQTRSWEDRDGNTRYTTEVKAQEVQFLGETGAPSPEGDPPPSQQGAPEPQGGDKFEPDDELPF